MLLEIKFVLLLQSGRCPILQYKQRSVQLISFIGNLLQKADESPLFVFVGQRAHVECCHPECSALREAKDLKYENTPRYSTTH